MLHYLIYLIFILSVAFAAGGVELSSRLRKRYNHDVFSTLLYFQVFIYTFGFYGIWGQVVIKAFLYSYISADLLARFSDISILLGLPFLVFAWLMLLSFSFGISGRKSSNWKLFWFLLLNFSLIIIVGYFITKTSGVKPVSLIKSYFIAMNILYSVIASLLILFPGKGKPSIHNYDRKLIAPSIFIIMAAQCIPLMFYNDQPLIAVIFIFTFFAGNSFLPVYLNYGTHLSGFTAEPLKDLSFEEFCEKYEVSPRETEITSKGLRYPLIRTRIRNWWVATLNEAKGDSFSLEFSKGRVIVYLKFYEK